MKARRGAVECPRPHGEAALGTVSDPGLWAVGGHVRSIGAGPRILAPFRLPPTTSICLNPAVQGPGPRKCCLNNADGGDNSNNSIVLLGRNKNCTVEKVSWYTAERLKQMWKVRSKGSMERGRRWGRHPGNSTRAHLPGRAAGSLRCARARDAEGNSRTGLCEAFVSELLSGGFSRPPPRTASSVPPFAPSREGQPPRVSTRMPAVATQPPSSLPRRQLCP